MACRIAAFSMTFYYEIDTRKHSCLFCEHSIDVSALSLVTYNVGRVINVMHMRVCCGSYVGVQGAGNGDCFAVATQGVSKRNPCWLGWRPAGGRGQCVYACHRALESSMAQTDASDY